MMSYGMEYHVEKGRENLMSLNKLAMRELAFEIKVSLTEGLMAFDRVVAIVNGMVMVKEVCLQA